MEKIIVDVGKHASRGLEGMVGGLESGLIRPVLAGSMRRKDGGDVEDDGGLFEGEGILRRGLVGECIKPGR